jgi:death-on-curing protein
MDEPVWITKELARAIHARQLAEHGGIDGVRDAGLLDSALARPKHLFAYSSPPTEPCQLAAAYASGIIQNQPFLDGNNRNGYVVCRTFLKLNDWDIRATLKEKYVTFLQLAEGSLSQEELAEWLRERLERDGAS